VRLLITAVAGGRPVDLAVEAADDARVADLATVIGRALGDALVPVAAGGPPTLRVVGSAPVETPAPALYLGGRLLDPAEPLSSSAVRHGAVLGVAERVSAALVEPGGLVEVRITSGPGAGGVVRLDPGEYVLGTTPDCDVRVDTPELPGVALRLRVRSDGAVVVEPAPEVVGLTREAPSRRRRLPGPIVLGTREMVRPKKPKAGVPLPEGTVTTDAADDVPLVHVDRAPLETARQWLPGEVLGVGTVLLELRPVTAPDASLSRNPAGENLDYNRPPRILPPVRTTAFTLPAEPTRPEKLPLPLALMLLPMLTGLAMWWFTHSPLSLIICALSPLMALSQFTSGRRQAKVRYLGELDTYLTRTARIQEDAFEALVEERAARRRDFVDAAETLVTAVGPRMRLWERRQADPDFLLARVGTADQPSEVSMRDPGREDHEGDLVWTAPDVPVVVPLAEAGVTGVAGPPEARLGLARFVLGQLAVLHSPADLDVVLLTESSAAEDWNWVRWLPHVRSDLGDSELAHVGVDDETVSLRIAELLRTLDERTAAARDRSSSLLGGGGGAVTAQPMLVVLDGARRLRLLPGVPQLLAEGPAVRMYFLCLDADERLLPEECQVVVDAGHAEMTVRRTGHGDVEGVRPDLVGTAWAELVARTLAPIRDVSAVAEGGSLPSSSRLLDVIRLDPPSEAAVLERWRSVGRTTQAVIGEAGEGPFSIDIRLDGPHGLVAGTTGSGKSELLQTIIASLAVNNRPDEMNFVLVDYKGGAAFKDCNELPHTVGMVTDLDGHLTTRALESLGAELRRREHQLAGAGAKDIEDYLAAKGDDDAPMPRLLIVIDEFAALVAELPDFVTGLVDIARRGRSLGVHLILATQRPAGVVSAEIKSNTNLRIALRVTDGGDSSDVIEAPDAAQIAKSTPGRGYARLGHSSLIPFQSARVGGRPRDAEAGADVRLRSVSFDTLGTPERQRAQAEEDVSVPTDLASLVHAAQAASATSGVVAPAPPWLPALDPVVTLEALLEQVPAAAGGDRLRIPFGLTDIPAEQRRDAAYLDLERGSNLGIVSAPRAGRSTALRAIAGAIARDVSPEDVHVYGVDCGNNALLPLVALPHVGAVVTRNETDRMDRLVTRLRQLVSERQQQLAMAGFADVTEQRASVPPEQRMPYVVVLFDRWEGFAQAYEDQDGGRLVLAWQQLLQEGAGAGLRIVVTGDRTLTVGRMSTLVEDKLMLRMVDPTDFGAIGMSSRAAPATLVDGRGFRAEGLRETQIVLLDPDASGTAQVAALQRLGREAADRFASVARDRLPFRLDVLPARIGITEARRLADASSLPPTLLPVAVGGDTLGLRGLDAVENGPALLVTGGRRSGRSTTLRTMAAFALEAGWEVVLVTPRISPLRDLAGQPGVHGPFDASSDPDEVTELLTTLRAGQRPTLTLVDDVELVGNDDWLADLVVEHADKLRDTGSLLVGAGTPGEVSSQYRGPAATLKKSGSGLMLAPQSSTDADNFGVRLARSAYGQAMPPGGGYLVRGGALERVQVIWPEG
jgi:DNA segregation ATPase FtsK/SpoIIIE, S-DNA-T family